MSIKFSSKLVSVGKENTDGMMIFACGKTILGDGAKALDKIIGGKLSQLINNGDLGAKPGDNLILFQPEHSNAKRIVLIQTGDKMLGDRAFLAFADSVAACCVQAKVKNISLFIDKLTIDGRDNQWLVRKLTEACISGTYQYQHFKSDKGPAAVLNKVVFLAAGKASLAQYQQGMTTGTAIGEGISLARDLGNCPPNICHPVYLSQQATAMARDTKNLSVNVLGEKAMEALGMQSLLSVGQGSAQPSQLIICEYSGAKEGAAPYALVGKGITFDSGGISLKPGAAMDEMKYDMCGAASVLGCLQAIVDMQLPINLVCVIAAAENMPSDCASRPGDIVTSMSGKTIEILNTDAEGRLVLCDALTYVQRFKPKIIIDIATLTGACVRALGRHASGLYSNDECLSQALLDAGQRSGDRAWPMPLWDDYTQQLKSNFADLGNIGGLEAGSVTAACFLAEFTKEATWAHLDICGTAWLKGDQKGATGRPVGLLADYLMEAM